MARQMHFCGQQSFSLHRKNLIPPCDWLTVKKKSASALTATN